MICPRKVSVSQGNNLKTVYENEWQWAKSVGLNLEQSLSTVGVKLGAV